VTDGSVGRHGRYERHNIRTYRDADGIIRAVESFPRLSDNTLSSLSEAMREIYGEALEGRFTISEAPDDTYLDYHGMDLIGPSGNGLINIRDVECWIDAYGDHERCLNYSSDCNIVLASRVTFDKVGLAVTFDGSTEF